MKNLVYLCVLSLAILPLLNCAPKDKQLRQSNAKDPDVEQLEVASVMGLDYTYYLTIRAAEAKQLIELALKKEIKQPASSCVDIIPQFELNGVAEFKIVADCSFVKDDNKIEFLSKEDFKITKDDKGVLYKVELKSLRNDWAQMLPKDSKNKSKLIELNPVSRTLIAKKSMEETKKGEQIFDVTYTGTLQYEQTIFQGKLKAVEIGTQVYTLEGQYHVSTSGDWKIVSPRFELDVKAIRTLTNSKKRNEKVTPKVVDLYLSLKSPATKKIKAVEALAFVGDCDRLAGLLSVEKYEHKTTEKYFTGAIGMGRDSMKLEKTGGTLELPACEKAVEGYAVQAPIDLIYLK